MQSEGPTENNMICKINCFMVPENPTAATSRAVSRCRCEFHSWDFGDGFSASVGTLCPLGRIEKAVEDGIAKIAEVSHS